MNKIRFTPSSPGILGLAVLALLSLPAATSFGTSGLQKITNDNSNKVLEVVGGSTANGALIDQYDYSGVEYQRSAVTPIDSTYSKIINLKSGKALEVPNGASTEDLQLQQSDYVGNAWQQ